MFGMGFPSPSQIIASALVFILAISVHEFMHAWTANALGDDTAKREGRITLNPVAHFDPIGFLFGLLLIFRHRTHRVGQAGASQSIQIAWRPARHGRRCHRRSALEPRDGHRHSVIAAATHQRAAGAGVGTAVIEFLYVLTGSMISWNVALFRLQSAPDPAARRFQYSGRTGAELLGLPT